MQLDRNFNSTGKGKYAVINLRKIPGAPNTPEALAAAILANPECVEWGSVGEPNEFFVLKLKDANADAALYGYAGKAMVTDPQYAAEVAALAGRAGTNSPHCKAPD